ncbi:MAG: hydroxyacid dehydrogenase [Clostridiales bacterium]|jgi:uncharacterized protein YgbK (DUF1537 family)|nr:hydroxyacid dehydrogenase [Clostridiales bacterium]
MTSFSEISKSVPDYPDLSLLEPPGPKPKIIVLDDDPTGTQTVRHVNVYCNWSANSIQQGLSDSNSMFYILTNSRSLTPSQTESVHKEIAANIASLEKDFILVSRSDSTLRGHYPLETDTLSKSLASAGIPIHGEIIYPFFPEGGRYTVGDVHYVRYGDQMIPAGETEFASDKAFGYKSSHLAKWIEEKTAGAYKAQDVISISLEELRALDIPGISDKLISAPLGSKIIVNSLSYDDTKVFVSAFWKAYAAGKRYLFRSAAALVKTLGGVSDKPPLSSEELSNLSQHRAGLIIAGSHVQKTTLQLEALRERKDIAFLELNQHLALYPDAFEAEAARIASEADQHISNKRTVAIMTRRDRFDSGQGKEAELKLSASISEKLTGIVARLKSSPGFIIAKGGITSSDTATRGIGMEKALVLGQILPGVPVWQAGPETRFPGLVYVVFPGNVGDEDALKKAVEKFMQ